MTSNRRQLPMSAAAHNMPARCACTLGMSTVGQSGAAQNCSCCKGHTHGENECAAPINTKGPSGHCHCSCRYAPWLSATKLLAPHSHLRNALPSSAPLPCAT